jgi:thiamine biosynthesis protein ThiS
MTTITIRINGQKIILNSPCSLNQALYIWSTMDTGSNPNNSDIKCYVIALNQTFVPRNHYDSTRLTSGDTLELLSPMAGG